jgi:hypothetical protein
MCIIAYQPIESEFPISYDKLDNCYVNNPDFVGYMFVTKSNDIRIKKFEDFECFYESYVKDFRNNPDTPFVIHFRLATSGFVNKVNCHPFFVNQNLAFCHNGVLDIDVPLNSKISDTMLFNKTILQKLPAKFLSNKGCIELILNYISGDKLVFLDRKKRVTIMNEDKGMWENGTWFSNCGFMSKYNYFSTYDTKYGYSGQNCPICDKFLKSYIEYQVGFCYTCIDQYDIDVSDNISEQAKDDDSIVNYESKSLAEYNKKVTDQIKIKQSKSSKSKDSDLTAWLDDKEDQSGLDYYCDDNTVHGCFPPIEIIDHKGKV